MLKQSFGHRIYDVEEWAVPEHGIEPSRAARGASVFAVANGCLGVRGGFEEADHDDPHAVWPSLMVGGIYENEPIAYAESAFGFPVVNQRTPLLGNPMAVRFSLNGRRIGNQEGAYVEHDRRLDLTRGVLERRFVWRCNGDRLEVRMLRFACFTDKHLLVHRVEIIAPDGGEGRVMAGRVGRQALARRGHDPREGVSSDTDMLLLATGMPDGDLLLDQRLRHSGLRVLMRARQHIDCGSCSRVTEQIEGGPFEEFWFQAEPGGKLVLDRFIAVVDGRRVDESRLDEEAQAVLARAQAIGVPALVERQEAMLADFWCNADVQIAGDPEIQQGLRFNLFHIFQSSGRDSVFPIAAKGLTGNGYDGHVFWDGEIYVLPFLAHAAPQMARALLQFRCRTLSLARARARELAHAQGALYPWRTVDGSECSAYFPAGTAQYHINADIAYAIHRYWKATGDDEFLRHAGVELMIETARIWLETGHYNPRRGGAFCIDEVTGPDEYTALVSNNFYTNVMAQLNLELAARCGRWLAETFPEDYAQLIERLGLADDELDRFAEAAERMYIPYDEALGIHPQDDGFLDKKPWDLSTIPPEHFPLLLHYHPLVIYRHRVCKQPDVLLALFLLADRFSTEQKGKNFRLYEPITTHDSTLSACVHAIIAAEIGEAEKAYQFFIDTARVDLDDHHENTHQGVHCAAMAGTWASLVCGFGGFRIVDNVPCFAPQLPANWTGYTFRLLWHGARLQVQVTETEAIYTLLRGDTVCIGHAGDRLTLHAGTPVTRPLLQPEAVCA